MGFPRQEYWNWLPFPSLDNLPNPGRDRTCVSCLADRFFTTEPPGKPDNDVRQRIMDDCVFSDSSIKLEMHYQKLNAEQPCAVLCLVTQSYLTFLTPWTAAHQAPLSQGFSRQESWSGLPCPSLSNDTSG